MGVVRCSDHFEPRAVQCLAGARVDEKNPTFYCTVELSGVMQLQHQQNPEKGCTALALNSSFVFMPLYRTTGSERIANYRTEV